MDEAPYTSQASVQMAPLRNDPEYVAHLEQRISALERRLPQTQLLSPSFLRRAFAVVGHYFVAGLIIEVVVLALIAAVAGIGAGVAALFHLG